MYTYFSTQGDILCEDQYLLTFRRLPLVLCRGLLFSFRFLKLKDFKAEDI